MPVVAAGAIASGFISGTTIAAGIGFSFSAFAGSLILGGLSYALTPKPKSPNFSNQTQGSNVAIRQSDLIRKHVFGHTRVVTGFAHMESTGVNKELHLVLILCEGELRAINEVWVNDYAISPSWIDGDGNVTTGRYAGKMVIRKHLGSPDQVADPLAVTNMDEWTVDHRLQGIAYLYIILTKDQDVYPNGLPNFSAVVEGPVKYDPRTDSMRWSTNMALYCNDYLQSSLYGFGIDGDDIDTVNVSAEANICDEIVDTDPEAMAVSTVSAAGNSITLTGDLLKLQFGDRVQISSTGSVPGGLSAGVDYYVVPYQVKDFPIIFLATSLDNAMAKNIIDLSSDGSGTITITKTGEPRYHGSGVVETDQTLSSTLNNFANGMAGRAVCIGGFWTLAAGAWRSPQVTYTIGDLRGPMSFQSDQSMAESYNVVKGLFISSLNYYQPSDYPSAVYDTFIEQDNNIESVKEIDLPFTNRPTTAQRIAKIELFRGRQGIAFNSNFSTKALQNQPTDNVYLDIERIGWEQKAFEITEFTFEIAEGRILTSQTLRETAQAIYDWSAGEAIDYDPAPNTNLTNPFNVQVPVGVSYNSRYIETRDGDAVYTLTLLWDPHPDSFVTQFGDFEVQYKLSAEADWRPSFFVDGNLTQTDVVNSSVNIYYDIRIRARNNLGVRSGWVTILNAVVGSSGGVGDTEDWRLFSESVTITQDWGTFSDVVGPTNDWEYFV